MAGTTTRFLISCPQIRRGAERRGYLPWAIDKDSSHLEGLGRIVCSFHVFARLAMKTEKNAAILPAKILCGFAIGFDCAIKDSRHYACATHEEHGLLL